MERPASMCNSNLIDLTSYRGVWPMPSQSVSHYHTPSRELMALTLYSGLLFKCAAGISASSNADASSSFFWKVSYFRMVFCSFHFLPIFLLAQIL